MDDFALLSPDFKRPPITFLTPESKLMPRPGSSPGASPLRHRQVLEFGGLGLQQHLMLCVRNPRPHRLQFDSSAQLLNSQENEELIARPAGDSPDKENEGRSRITSEKLPALAPRFMVPQPPPHAPVAQPGHRIRHYSNIVMQPPAGGGSTPKSRKVNWKLDAPQPIPKMRIDQLKFDVSSPKPKRHGAGLEPLEWKQPVVMTPKNAPTTGAFTDSPLTPYGSPI